MTDRIPLRDLTSDQLDALYEQLEAAQQTELARQLATCDKAFASATFRAAKAEARVTGLEVVIARVRQMADHWEQALPDVIRTPAVVSALRAALDRAQQPTTKEA